MSKNFNNGVWPVMLTPFTDDNRVDYDSLEKLINWYIENGVAGLFADCQSSEMFFLSLEERVELARFIKEKAAGRVPVVASGHISDMIESADMSFRLPVHHTKGRVDYGSQKEISIQGSPCSLQRWMQGGERRNRLQ